MEKVPHNKSQGPEGLLIAVTAPLRIERKSPPRCVTDGPPDHAASGLFQLVRCRVFIVVIIIIFVSIIIINIVVFLTIIPTTFTIIIIIINAIIFVSIIIINMVIVVFLTIIPTTFTIINAIIIIPITTIITPITSTLFSLRYEHQPFRSS
ncbi:unnamed protein product [Boreogadus saida]